MSVIRFSKEEFARIGACLAGQRYTDRKRTFETVATVCEANRVCYADKYGGHSQFNDLDAAHVSAEELEATARRLFPYSMGAITKRDSPEWVKAETCARMLHYNCVDDTNGLEKVAGAYDALCYILRTFLPERG